MTTVTCAIIEKEDKILIARRAQDQTLAGKWEFPGGKVEIGESPEECLKRELEEEFGIQAEVGEFITSSNIGSPKVHCWFLAPRKVKSVISPFLANQ